MLHVNHTCTGNLDWYLVDNISESYDLAGCTVCMNCLVDMHCSSDASTNYQQEIVGDRFAVLNFVLKFN